MNHEQKLQNHREKRPKDLGHTNTKCHNMIASLTTSDLRNTLCGRLKLQKTQKMKITLSQIQSDPLLAYCRTLNFY